MVLSSYIQAIQGPKGKFNPKSREDTLSRQVWKDTVLRGDQTAEHIYQIKKGLCKYPENICIYNSYATSTLKTKPIKY